MKTITGIAVIMGTVIGAGILGLPYAVSIAGFIPGIALMVVITLAMTLLLLYIGEVVLKCKEVYQLPGLVNKYLGKKWALITLLLFTLSIYAALISYVTGTSETLKSVIPLSDNALMILFTAALALPVIKGTKVLGKTQLTLMIIKISLVIIISMALIPQININNLSFTNLSRTFYPFGVIFFALTGYSVIPELEQVLFKHESKFKKSVITAMIGSALIYAIFIIALLGTYGSSINEVGTESLTDWIRIAGIGLALLSMTTPFIGLSIALKNSFIQDAGMNNKLATTLTLLTPLFINLLFKPSFITPLIISGTYSGALTGFIITGLWIKTRKIKTTHFKAPFGMTGAALVITTLTLGVIMTTLDLTGLI